MTRSESPWQVTTKALRACIHKKTSLKAYGRVTEVIGTIIKAVVPNVELGELCHIQNPGQTHYLLAEVVGLNGHHAILTPIGDMHGISTATEVIPTGRQHDIIVSNQLLGYAVNGLGEPMAGYSPLDHEKAVRYPVHNAAPNPMSRQLIKKTMPLGIRAIDGLLTCGEGQRIGIFAAAGGGKSTLLSMLAKGADADVIVIALIGERGREVREFMEQHLDDERRSKAVLVVATSDRPAMERAKAAYVATTIAEYFRDQGKSVLLLMDSVTRFARALREIGLASGEPPTRRGFPPSVFSDLPKLMERVGQNEKGAITAFYTVLVEGDDMTEPVADETRSILDGHIILSRELAMANHFPAIDILASASRVMDQLIDDSHRQHANDVRRLLAKYREVELLVNIGEYQQGSDPEADRAIEKINSIQSFLRQGTQEHEDIQSTVCELKKIA